MTKFITAQEAASLIPDEAWCATTGDGLAAWPNEVSAAIRQRFLEEGHPRNIGMIHGPGIGNFSVNEYGTTGLSLEGLLTKSIAGFVGTNPIMVEQILNNEITSYMIPLGTLLQLFHEAGRGMPGMLSKVGLGTFVDPRVEGGKCNEKTKAEEDIVTYVPDFMGEEWLWYKTPKVDVGLISGSIADRHGNISCETQTSNLAHLALAQAVKANGGILIVQVEKIVEPGDINPHMVKIPGMYVDYVVQAQDIDKIPQNMARTNGNNYNPAFTGESRVDISQFEQSHPLPLDAKKVISRRAALELEDGQCINLGMGIPQILTMVLKEQGREDFQIISETGSIGGIPGTGLDFGCHWNVESMVDACDHFGYFDSGALDIGCFGAGEIDRNGCINVSHLSGTIKGLGGFANISANAKKAIFLTTFTSGGLQTEIADGEIHILQEGKIRKFIQQCHKVSYVASEALKNGKQNIYITERCVFRYTEEGLTLTEIAPGIDLERDILAQMDFQPVIPEGGPKLMDADLFRE